MESKAVVTLLAVLLVVQSCAASRQVLQHVKEKSTSTPPNSYGGHDNPTKGLDSAHERSSSDSRPPPTVPSSSPLSPIDVAPSGGIRASGASGASGPNRRHMLQHGHSGGGSPTNTVAVGYTYSDGKGKWGVEATHTEHTGGSTVTVSGHVDSQGNAGASASKTDTKRGGGH